MARGRGAAPRGARRRRSRPARARARRFTPRRDPPPQRRDRRRARGDLVDRRRRRARSARPPRRGGLGRRGRDRLAAGAARRRDLAGLRRGRPRAGPRASRACVALRQGQGRRCAAQAALGAELGALADRVAAEGAEPPWSRVRASLLAADFAQASEAIDRATRALADARRGAVELVPSCARRLPLRSRASKVSRSRPRAPRSKRQLPPRARTISLASASASPRSCGSRRARPATEVDRAGGGVPRRDRELGQHDRRGRGAPHRRSSARQA